MARLYSNENFPLPVVVELQRLGHDVLTIQETGKAGQSLSDRDMLDFASEQGKAVLTLNRKHFVQIHNSHLQHEGIIVCTFDPDFVGRARRIQNAIESRVRLTGQLIRINRPAE